MARSSPPRRRSDSAAKSTTRRFPSRAVDYCLREAGLTPEQLDYVGFYDKPLLKFERLLETYLAYAPSGFASFRAGDADVAEARSCTCPARCSAGLRRQVPASGSSSPNITSRTRRARSFPSPFEEAAILTLDGVGEWATATCRHRPRQPHSAARTSMQFPHSLGLLYSAFTYFCGFKVNSGEYKLMGLAPYGEPSYVDLILEKLIDLKDDGSFRHGHVVLQLLPGPDDDVDEVRRALRRPAAQARDADHRSATWISPPRSRR